MSASCQMLSSRTLALLRPGSKYLPAGAGQAETGSRTPRCCVQVANLCPLLRGRQRRFPELRAAASGSRSLPRFYGRAETSRTPRCCVRWNLCPLLRAGNSRTPLLRPGSESLPASTGRAETGSRTPRCCVRANLCPLLRGGRGDSYNSQLFTVLGKGLRRGCWTFRSDT